jgi:hypothetical protein
LAVGQARLIVARSIRQQGNAGIGVWFEVRAARLSTRCDLNGFLEHLLAVQRHCGLMIAMVSRFPTRSSSAA